MITVAVGIFLGIFFALIMFNAVVLTAFRRENVSVLDGLFKFYFKHGFFWFYRNPELYFKDRYAKIVRLAGIIGVATFLIIFYLVFLTQPHPY